MKELLGLVTHDRAPIKRCYCSPCRVFPQMLRTALILREESIKRRSIKFFFDLLQFVLLLAGFAILLATLTATFVKSTRFQRCWRELELTAKPSYLVDRGGHFRDFVSGISCSCDYHIYLLLMRLLKGGLKWILLR